MQMKIFKTDRSAAGPGRFKGEVDVYNYTLPDEWSAVYPNIYEYMS